MYEQEARTVLRMEHPVALKGPFRRLRGDLVAHSERMADHVRQISVQCGFDPRQSDEIVAGALLHDIGKVEFDPDHLDDMPWTDELRATMHIHPLDSERIALRHGFPLSVRRIIRHHHEFEDGTGYIDGLKGLSIPIGSAIVKLADEWDRMRNITPWRSFALTPQQALAEWGTHFGERYPVSLRHVAESWYQQHGQRAIAIGQA